MYEYDFRVDECKWAGAIEEVTGYSFEEIRHLGKYFWITNIEHLKENPVSMYPIDVRLTGDRFKEELRLRRKDGTYIFIENRGSALRIIMVVLTRLLE